MGYGVETWGPAQVAAAVGGDGNDKCKIFHRAFLRRLLGVRKATANVVTLGEFVRFPLACAWAKRIYGFWRRLQTLPDTRVTLKAAFQDNLALAQENVSSRRCWAAQVLGLINALGLESGVAGSGVVPAGNNDMDDPRLAEAAMCQRYMDSYRQQSGTKIDFYKATIRGGDTTMSSYILQPYLSSVLSVPRRVSLARFRCSSHHLGVETGRFIGRLRAQRTCRLCASGSCEDEEHMVFHCTCPSVVSVRESYSSLFPDTSSSSSPPSNLFEFL